ncbi:hypothetical protein TWF106_010426 [Orbilia oligospora]|uniref:Uncharacterized protein n=1 Tax=Orbilia oligospora TaxID=2813651 RepID=A0A6G1M9C0_ORBOL|nr:hypothetical protein TWF679_008268 [Orbilia oligospora]KAF3210765.1 hypothetical protein TWF106_010426 [Orbilia oligospora]KAF3213542.1 hypothetical protein TWF191_010019 [Orbilia oligospora]KAF3249473.1 hypothetical protein TWF192_005545 [Orbilia oligospora]
MSLDSEVARLKSRLYSASNNLDSLEIESKDTIDAELWILQSALQRAATDTVHLITESKKGRNLLLFRTDKSITRRLATQLNVVIQSLDASIASSDRVLNLSMLHVRRVEDFKNESLQPMRQNIKVTVTRVEHKKATATAELNAKRKEASQAAAELNKASIQLDKKQTELSSTRSRLWSKQREARSAEEQQASYERQAREYRERATAASERAHKLRKRAVWTTVLTLGVGIGFAIADACEASDLDTSASDFASEAQSSASSASQLRSTCASIERQIGNLETESRVLESQKASLEWRKEQQQKEVNSLQSSVSNLNQEVASANTLASDLASVNRKTDELAEKTRLLSRSLQKLKADISHCLETLTEQREFGALTARKANKAYISDEKRLQLLESAGEVLPQINQSQKMLPSIGPTAKRARQQKKSGKLRKLEK